MHVPAELEALRRDHTLQRRAQSAVQAGLAQWQDRCGYPALLEDLAGFAAGAGIDGLPRLASLFAAGSTAPQELVGELVRVLTAQLAEQPLGHVPLRHHSDAVITSLLLARSGGATLSLEAIDGAELARCPAPVSVSFSPSETWEYVLAGSARIDRFRLGMTRGDYAELHRDAIDLAAGMVSHRDGAGEALMLRSVPRSLITLKLQRRPGRGVVVREYALADGRLLHEAAAHSQDSRLELAAALLGRMGRNDAAPLLAAMALEPGGRSLRWQALRECLGLDSVVGFAAVSRLAGRTADPLAAPAAALRQQLLATYPQLAALA
ncbi:MAG: hypothetical protein RLZZ427_311 [Pseudomonadota bacterium]|jgi:hypothetical protein